MRDVDPNVRRAVYAVVLNPDKAIVNDDMIDVTHPRAMKISDREQIVRNGLGDREEAVKVAAAKLISGWVDVVQTGIVKNEREEADIIAFLRLFDLVHEGTVAEDALLSVFKTRVDILDSLTFGGRSSATMLGNCCSFGR